ncbi:MAG: diguanylate cyclase [Nitrococcus mobilis]|nr:diguanylate cyclase [Nitrococcus mobilis]
MERYAKQARERRSGRDRRRSPSWRSVAQLERIRYPGWWEQLLQFLTRYLFMVLGIVFFNYPPVPGPLWLPASTITAVLLGHGVLNTILLWHAVHRPICPARYRLAMWVDLVAVSLCVANDPYQVPPSVLAFIMVVLGNGMRYGMVLFAEAIVGTFAGAMVALSVNGAGGITQITPGLVFLNLFGGIILLYTYVLMSRIERSRFNLEERSRLDCLTGLVNRRALEEAADTLLRGLLEHGGEVAVMFADMDDFKQINDRHGHGVGDLVLRRFARILQRSIRSHDIAARYGGDEFVLILLDIDLAGAERVARRIQESVAVWARENALCCTVTFGLAAAPRHGTSLPVLLRAIDEALYRGKRRPERGGAVEWVTDEGVKVSPVETPMLAD